MRVLLITTEREDYLQDSIIHGFKELFGIDAFDYPVKAMLYNDFNEMETIRGNGFTIYGLIDKKYKPQVVLNLHEAIKSKKFDKIIFTSIFRQSKLFYQLYPLLKMQKENVLIIDGEDTDMLFPYISKFFKSYFFWSGIRAHKHFTYFKREISINTIRSYYYRLLPFLFLNRLKLHINIKPIAFSIPQSKIVSSIPEKTKLFSEHIVDAEVAGQLLRNGNNYAFRKESEYYADLQQSKFGITTKRAGWDCLRHYEIAANGAVICFRDLQNKPQFCAPHGLIDGFNCISYANYQDLMNRISDLTDESYNQLLARSLEWVNKNTTIKRVKSILSEK